MTPLTSQHLTDDQFAQCLTGEFPDHETQAHLAACDACSAELNLFRASVDEFSDLALGWSKAQPMLAPRGQDLLAARGSGHWPGHLGWALAAACVLAVGVPLTIHQHQAAPLADDDTPAQIAQDNNLMQSVNVALATTDPSPFSEYRLADAPQKNAKGRPESRIE
jgi:anti-sigma factor RsiW